MEISSEINMKSGKVPSAYIADARNFSAVDILQSICNIDEISDFDSACIVIEDFARSANEDTGFIFSVWID